MIRGLLCCVVLALTLAACTPGGVPVAEAGVRVWIDQPLNGSEYAAGETVSIRWHAAAVEGIQQVEVRVNGAALGMAQDFDHAAPLVTLAHDWTPPGPGEYLIQVIATGTNHAASLAAEKRIRVLGTATAAGGIVRGAVYADLNTDGDADDDGEGPLSGVTVTLSQCADQSQATGADGTFYFAGLPAGTCLVAVDRPGWDFAGTFPPEIGYPARAASDPALPTAFSFFMAPVQGGITPSPATLPTQVPATRTPTPRPTVPAVPTATRTPVPQPTPYLTFWADATSLVAGQCTTLHWDSANIQSLYLNGEGVVGTDVRTVCPATTTTYTLVANTAGGQISREVTIAVAAPPATPTPTPLPPPTHTPSPTPDTQGPPAPHIVGPANGVLLECVAPVTLDWDAPYDPSGISNYRVRLQRWTGAEWVDQRVWDPVIPTQVDARNDTDCGIGYRWRVLARDGAGNGGDVSEWAEFGIALP